MAELSESDSDYEIEEVKDTIEADDKAKYCPDPSPFSIFLSSKEWNAIKPSDDSMSYSTGKVPGKKGELQSLM